MKDSRTDEHKRPLKWKEGTRLWETSGTIIGEKETVPRQAKGVLVCKGLAASHREYVRAITKPSRTRFQL